MIWEYTVMKLLQLLLVAALAGGVLLGCTARQQISKDSTIGRQPTPARASPPVSNANGHDHAAESAVPRIGVMEAQAAVNRGEAVFLDVRQPLAYSTGRIKGAILMPEAEISSRAGTLPRDKRIITYCT